MHKYSHILILLLFISSTISLFPQQNFETEFRLGLDLYNASQFNDALEIFNKISSSREQNSHTTIALLFEGKTLLRLKRYPEAERSLNRFLEIFPKSVYADEVRLTLAKVYLENSEFRKAFTQLTEIINSTKSPYYKNYSKTVGEKLALKYLSSSDVHPILSKLTDQNLIPYLLLLQGKLYLNEGRINSAEESFLKVITQYPESTEKTEASELYKNARNNAPKVEGVQSVIGVLLPLDYPGISDEIANASAEILEGIKFSVAEFNEGREDKIGLLVRNTEMSSDKIEEIKDEISSLPIVRSIIGPIYSDEVRSALQSFKSTEIPLISPTATDNDLTEINSYFFQANPSFAVRGKIMAQYIYFVENKRKMGVLNAIEGYSPLLASTFEEEFKKLGGEIVIHETYKSKSFDVSSPVKKISAYLSEIEGLYIPIADKADAPVILSELSQIEFTHPIYGNQDWMLAKRLETSPALADKLTFSSDYFIDYNSPDFLDFSQQFYTKTQKDVNRNILYGFDTGKYLLTVLRNNSSTGKALKQKLESGITSNGFHNNISFDENRINRFLNIIRYRDKKFELVDKFKSSN